MKSRPLVTKKYKGISIYIKLAQPHQKAMKIFTGSNHTQKFLNHTGLLETVEKLNDLEKYWTKAASNL